MPLTYLFDWGDTLMVDFPGVPGKMCDWETVEAVDGAREALAALSQNASLYVATGAAQSTEADIRTAFSRVGLDRFITGYFCKSNLGIEKGSPGFFRAILDRLGCPPEAAAMVGDSLEKDIRPALALGITGIWLTNDTDIDPGPGCRKIVSLRELIP